MQIHMLKDNVLNIYLQLKLLYDSVWHNSHPVSLFGVNEGISVQLKYCKLRAVR